MILTNVLDAIPHFMYNSEHQITVDTRKDCPVVYILGGGEGLDDRSDKIGYYDPDKGSWAILDTRMPVVRHSAGITIQLLSLNHNLIKIYRHCIIK